MSEDRSFLSRWSQRKALAERGEKPPEPAARPDHPSPVKPATAVPPAESGEPLAPPPSPPPTLEEALKLKPDSADFSRFVSRGVDPQVKHQALRTLFSDPHFNVMDGLDVYIDDYNTPDPLPGGMLRKMVQSSLLGLFDDDKPRPVADAEASVRTTGRIDGADETAADARPDTAAATPQLAFTAETPPDEDPAVRLQPDDDPGPGGDRSGTGQGLERQR